MSQPRVFISSTFYDLKYIRENIKYFVKTLGYEPVLSEEGSVFYDPRMRTEEACLAEVPNCQIFVLLVGGRFGGTYKDEGHSITNAEYRKAVELKIPVFALVENAVYEQQFVFAKNKENKDLDFKKITYPAVDDQRVFDFIYEVKSNTVNNAIVPFKDFADIELYLRQQWAGMMFSFLAQQNEERRVTNMLSELTRVNDKIEMLSQQILESVGSASAKLEAELYGELMSDRFLDHLSDMRTQKVKPSWIIANANFADYLKFHGTKIRRVQGRMGFSELRGRFLTVAGNVLDEIWEPAYAEVRRKLLLTLKRHSMPIETYLSAHKQELTNNLKLKEGMTKKSGSIRQVATKSRDAHHR